MCGVCVLCSGVNYFTCLCAPYYVGCLCNIFQNVSRTVEFHVAPSSGSTIEVGTASLMWVLFAPYNRQIYLGYVWLRLARR